MQTRREGVPWRWEALNAELIKCKGRLPRSWASVALPRYSKGRPNRRVGRLCVPGREAFEVVDRRLAPETEAAVPEICRLSSNASSCLRLILPLQNLAERRFRTM